MSNNVANSRIHDISENILKLVIKELTSSPFPFSLQLDESTDILYCSQLVSYVRYVNGDKIKEEFLFCEPLLDTAKASNVFKMLNEIFVKQNFYWKKKLGWMYRCMDGAPAMLKNKSRFAALVKNEAPNVTVTHCMLHKLP